jgi:probable HAF family extracellular repeat protein
MTAVCVAVYASVTATTANETITVVDIGTLGGSISSAIAINDSAQVTGYSSLAGDSAVGTFVWTAADGMVELGTLGGNYTVPAAMNSSGQVVGSSSITQLVVTASPSFLAVASGATDVTHAFSWTASGGIVDLGTLGGRLSAASSVNNSGQVVGISTKEDNLTSRAFLWAAASGMVDLGTLGGSDSEATAINDNGQIIGWSTTADGSPHAFLWTAASGMIDLGTIGGTQSFAAAINNLGQVVGFGENGDGLSHAFLWTADDGMVDLTPDDVFFESRASGIDESGRVVGVRSDLNGTHSFTWTALTGLVDLNALGGTRGDAFAAKGGQVVGDYGPAGNAQFRPFRWTSAGGMVDLGTLGGTNGRAVALNAIGSITAGGAQHATLWKPAVVADSTPPVITPSVIGALGSNSWYVGDVAVSWTVADPDSAISNQAGCDPVVLSADTPGTIVTCSATSAGGISSGSVTVRIDRTAPDLQSMSDVTVRATTPNGASVTYQTPSATDNLDANPTVTCEPGSGSFGVGDTDVNCQAADAAGNVTSGRFIVRVQPPVLDKFTGSFGSLGAGWCGSRTAFSIRSNSARVIGSGPIYWCDSNGAARFGVDQEVYVTLTSVDGSGFEQDLLLKVQGDQTPSYSRGEIEVIYDSSKRAVRVATLLPDNSAWAHYADVPVTLRSGDRFGARALSNGQVWIFVNGELLAKVTLNPDDQAFFNNKGGYVGLWFDKATNARFDDFGGGTLTKLPASVSQMKK